MRKIILTIILMVVGSIWTLMTAGFIWAAGQYTIVFDNFGCIKSFSCPLGSSQIIYASHITLGDVNVGNVFQPSHGGTLSDIWLAVQAVSAGMGTNLEVSLKEDNNGLPGNLLESWSFIVKDPKVYHGIGNMTTHLIAGTDYWLLASVSELPILLLGA